VYIIRPDFQAFIMVFPDDGRVVLQKAGHEFKAGHGQEFFRVLGGFLARLVVSGLRFALVLFQCATAWTGAYSAAQLSTAACNSRQILRRHQRFRAMLAEQSGFQHIARKTGRAGARQQGASENPAGAATIRLSQTWRRWACSPPAGKLPPADAKSAARAP